MNEVQARISEMRDAATSIASGATKIRDAVEQADKEILALGADRYQSPGADAFRANHARLKPLLLEAYERLMAFQASLNLAADEIQAAAGSTI